MGEKKKKNGKNEGEKKSDGGGKKEDGTITVVLKVNMDCDGCVEKVKRSVKGFKGVEAVKRDGDSNKLTVIGKVDPAKLCERVENKTGKKVELISPAVAKDSGGGEKKKSEGQSEKKNDEKKNKEPPVTTVVLKMDLHCEGCIQRIRRIISKKKGVQDLKIDPQKDLVTVKGTMDAKDLAAYLTKKMNRSVEIVPAKKEGSGGGGSEKKEKGGSGGGGGGGDGGGGGKKKEEPTIKTETNLDIYGSYGYPIHPQGHGYPIPPYAYPTQYPIQYPYPYPQYAHAPQLFSDENPNAACSIM